MNCTQRIHPLLILMALAGCLGWSVLLHAQQSSPANESGMTSELIFPLREEHNHAPGIVECSNGDLLVSWYRGSGERSADDVAVYGARLQQGESQWSEAFLMVDRPGFPDCNTCMMIDSQDRLWLFWPTILANTWESCITNYAISTDYAQAGSPVWNSQGLILLKPEDFSAAGHRVVEDIRRRLAGSLTERLENSLKSIDERLGDKLYQRLGWQPRCKPTVLADGRILLPLYTDTFSISIMAVSDDNGSTWYASQPLMGFGNIQPSVLARSDGSLVAYMRENGPLDRIRVCESKDGGIHWGPVETSDLPNPGSGLDGVRLRNGHWLLVYNDSTTGRNTLAVSVSDDEGVSWKWTRHLEQHADGAYHYPAVIQGADDRIHVVYSYFVEGGKSMKHAAFDESWVQAAVP